MDSFFQMKDDLLFKVQLSIERPKSFYPSIKGWIFVHMLKSCKTPFYSNISSIVKIVIDL